MDTKKLRQKILDLAIHGKLVPQDPNDEPASVLLERIRAEKERLISEGKIKRSRKSAKTTDTYHYENDVPFEVPAGWMWTTLPELCIIPITDGTHQTPTYTDKEQGVPFISSKDVTSQKINWCNIKYITRELHEVLYKRVAPQKDDILLAKNGTTGVAAIVEDSRVFDIYVTLAVIRPSKNVCPQYLHQVINSDFCKEQFNSHLTGIGLPNLHLVDIKKTVIPLPPLAEQLRIIKEIERWFALIDTIEQSKENLETAIKQAKNKILNLAIHGKLVPQDPSDEPASELLKRINPKAQITCDNEHYAQLPKGWAICSLEDIIEYEQPTDYIVSSTNYDDSYLTPVLTAGKSFIIGYTDEEEGLYSKLPCIIFDDFTTASKLVTFPFKVKSSAMKILQVNQNISIKYVAAFMSITQLIGDTHKRYWISEYSKLPIPIPPKEVQERIVTAIDNLFNMLDAIMGNL